VEFGLLVVSRTLRGHPRLKINNNTRLKIPITLKEIITTGTAIGDTMKREISSHRKYKRMTMSSMIAKGMVMIRKGIPIIVIA
jgi:hypothetical protein